jgi:hypothetical protein
VNTGISVICPAGGPTCSAAGSITANVPSSLAKAATRKKLTLCKIKATIAPGARKKLSCKLTSKGRRALRKLRKLKGKVAVTAQAGSGAPVAIAKTITLKQPKR